MSWDIHGEPLAPGHCEVHPWIHEPYPCGICVADGQRYEQERLEQEEHWRREEGAFYAALEVADLVAGDLGPFALAATQPHYTGGDEG